MKGRFLLCGVLALAWQGCEGPGREFLPNQRPAVRLSQAPIDTAGRYFYAYRMHWLGFDPDGRVDHYLYTVDPPSVSVVDSTWFRTTKNEQVLLFRASQQDTLLNKFHSIDYHTFAIRAVDNRGDMSRPVWRSFNSYTVAPQTWIQEPAPTAAFDPIVTPSVRIEWTGIDPDGQLTTKPIKYKYRLFSQKNPDFPAIDDFVRLALRKPDTLRIAYAPTFGPSAHCPSCSYWDSTGAESTFKEYSHLNPGSSYLFVVTGFDEAGAYDPVFDPSQNMLKFVVTYAGTNGPVITMFNEFFNFTYTNGGYCLDERCYYDLEVPAGQRVCFNWFATAPKGSRMRRYRWVMDLQDLTDETPRINEDTDWYHWSQWSLTNTRGCVGPFEAGQAPHLFYIEAEDNNGLRSLGIIRFTVVRATFEKDLLFVDDTRLTPDKQSANGELLPPEGEWPTAAELDTFLFARGGVPWRGYPAGTLSQPGIFKGYRYDTVGTRGITRGILPLSVLGKYKHVVWYTDPVGAAFNQNPTDAFAPTTALRMMSSPGQPSTLSTYLKQGGTLWLMGGGAALATLLPWNVEEGYIYTDEAGELIPGRFMYDFAHWRTGITMLPAMQANLLRPSVAFPFRDPTMAPGRGGPDQPPGFYSRLVGGAGQLQRKTPDSDPMPPLRDVNPSQFYLSSYHAEFLHLGNFIREDSDQLPGGPEESTLDTLYLAVGYSGGGRPVMTYYHGFESPADPKADPSGRARVVFSGFPLWYFQRSQQMVVGDWVLQEVFHQTRDPEPRDVFWATRARASGIPSMALQPRSNPDRVRRRR